ncbi:Cbb3-type cytochrome c oxidase subunit [Tistrella bauzanensis]|uniref:Cbb3-type cytochrome c oxidase subunit n=1 Tax=Tistrella bauzanensis TaxID=657419 RepID=A0ABQ1IMU7_9PROT|nr:cytochrome-c oxidase, cbb3-type subunit III [Tistrella bauzanensis]GGB47137.1 Cbb3-type cytochrome c oxidase subunit [Tistrella bauzanensis]
MPTKIEKDTATGRMTTGHEWDGIKELNTPLPKWWLYVFYISIAFSAVWVLLFPGIPLGTTYFKGLLGYSTRVEHVENLAAVEAGRADVLAKIRATDVADILKDPATATYAVAGGRVAFAENCAACHGAGGAGQSGYPALGDDSWLWGGDIHTIRQTLMHGIRSVTDPDTRMSEMPAFGQILDREQITTLTSYVLSLSGAATPAAAVMEQGQTLFADNCAACHGDNGQGNREFGAPSLADQLWLYGGTEAEVAGQITQPRHGVMPNWGGRLDEATINMLAVYVHSLGGGE